MRKILIFLCILLSQQLVYATTPISIKQTSSDTRIARLKTGALTKGTCTAALIGRSCMISAGHCEKTFYDVEFNTPQGGSYVGPRKSDSHDTYKVDRSSIVKNYEAAGQEDWAVFRVNKHSRLNRLRLWWMKKTIGRKQASRYSNYENGYYPGDLQGWYNVSTKFIRPNQLIHVTGYGTDTVNERYKSQHTSLGQIEKVSPWYSKHTFYHSIDGDRGDSGAGVIDNRSGRLIGVHTFHECLKNPNSYFSCVNGGTAISLTPAFKTAIQDCLNWEKENINPNS